MTFTCPNTINLFNVHSLLALVAFKFKTVVSVSFYLVSRFEIHYTATATMVKLLPEGSSSLCDTNLYKLIKEVRFSCESSSGKIRDKHVFLYDDDDDD